MIKQLKELLFGLRAQKIFSPADWPVCMRGSLYRQVHSRDPGNTYTGPCLIDYKKYRWGIRNCIWVLMGRNLKDLYRISAR